MFRLSSSLALFVLLVTLTVVNQPASGAGAATSATSNSNTSSNKGADLITPKQSNKLPGLATNNNQIPNENDYDIVVAPRQLANKLKTTGPDSMDAVLSAGGANLAIRSGRIAVKFKDELLVRCSAGLAGNMLTCASTRAAIAAGNSAAAFAKNPIAPAIALLDRFGGTVQPAINKTTQQLSDLEKRAAARSRKAQPDLAGYMYVTVTPSALTSAAEAFNELDCVEFAQVDYLPIPAQEGCPDVDLSLQKGPESEGVDIGLNCQTITDANGNTIPCLPPGPIFVVGSAASSLTGGVGAIGCSRPSRWAGYGTSSPYTTANCVTYTAPVVPPTARWDCTPNCNATARCTNPPIGFTSTSDCQYGCRDNVCAGYLSETLGFVNCVDLEQSSGWDSTCATLANIYCPKTIGSPTPYNNISFDIGMLQVDLATQNCYVMSLDAPQNYAFEDAQVYDACFTLRGPALNNVFGTLGIVKYTDIGNGDGIRPWGFKAPPPPVAQIPVGQTGSNFGYCFLKQILPNSSNAFFNSFSGVPACNGLRLGIPSASSQFFEGGEFLWAIDPTNAANAGNAEFDNAFKSFPFTFSHDCFDATQSTIPGCYTTPCCVYVCVNDSSCCSNGWDAACVNSARTNPTLCQSGAITSTATSSWTPVPPFRGIPNFDPVPIATSTEPFRARNLALFRTKLPNVLTTSEYNSQLTLIASGSITPEADLKLGLSYTIQTVGTTIWTNYGASSNNVGVIFTCTKAPGAITGTGIATANAMPGISPVSNTFAQIAPAAVTAPDINIGQAYSITTLGTTNWIAVGADIGVIGTIFVATAVGTGTGTATPITIPLPLDQTYDFINSGFSGGGIDIAGMEAFTTGIGVDSTCILGNLTQIGVIDYSAIIDHVDLLGQVTVEAGQTIVVPAPGTSTIINPDHGTAVLGVLVAADNGYGMTGLLPLAQATFFPAVTLAQGGRLVSALVSAGEQFTDGDVLCVPLEYGAGFTLASDPFVNQLFNVIDSLGTTVVIPAGNGGFIVQEVEEPIAITVGAVWPGRQTPVPFGSANSLFAGGTPYPGVEYCRFRSSNWSETIGAGGVDVAGWGTAICTLGEGTLFNDATTGVPATPQQNYQANFGQTSGACSMIAGLIGALNGFSEQVFGGSIGTDRIRNILNNRATNSQGNPTGAFLGSVIPQCGFEPGVPLPSTVSDDPFVVANGDIQPQPSTNHNVGGFPLANVCLENVFINESYPGGSPFDVQVITGTRISGNKFALGTLNNKFLQIQAQQKGRGSSGAGYGPSLQYVSTGLATDIQVRSQLLIDDISLLNDVRIQGYGMVSGGSSTNGGGDTSQGQALGIMYAYNRRANRWIYLNFGFINGLAPQTTGIPNLNQVLSSTGFNPQDFVVSEGSQNVLYTRFLTFGFGVIGPYRAFWDQIFIQMNPPLDRGE